MNIQVVIATHIPCAVPADAMYLPLQVGAQDNEPIGFPGDNTGENISAKNPTFCELTGLYWAWKNLTADYIGLVHYRRYFTLRRLPRLYTAVPRRVLTGTQAQTLLRGRDGLLPRRRHYVIENLYSHYAHTCFVEPLDETGRILKEKYPAYLPAFERLKTRTAAHMFNMFIFRREVLDAYCTWLFDILFELEKRVDPGQYSDFHSRYPGRIAELLLDVWLEQNPLDCVTVPVLTVGRVHRVRKLAAFLAAKFFGKKYEESF